MKHDHEAMKADIARLYRRAHQGDNEAVAEFFQKYGRHFLTVIRKRVHPRLRNIMDSDDFIQEFSLKAFANHDPKTVARNPAAQLLLLEQIALNVVQSMHRKYLDAQKRDLRREVPQENKEDTPTPLPG